MTDKEYLQALKSFNELKIDKEKWMTFSDYQRQELIDIMNEVSSYSSTYRKNKNREKYREKYIDIDPYGEENWEN